MADSSASGFSGPLDIAPPKAKGEKTPKRYVTFYDPGGARLNWFVLKVPLEAETEDAKKIEAALRKTLQDAGYPKVDALVRLIATAKVPVLPPLAWEEPAQAGGSESVLTKKKDFDRWLNAGELDKDWLVRKLAEHAKAGTSASFAFRELRKFKVLTRLDLARFPQLFDPVRVSATFGKLNKASLFHLSRDPEFQKKFDSGVTVEGSKTDFTSTAAVHVASTMDEKHLSLVITFDCNPEYMCKPYDLVPVVLVQPSPQYNEGAAVQTIAVIQATARLNHWVVKARYSWDHLVSLFKSEVANRLREARKLGKSEKVEVTKKELIELLPELGVQAQWLAYTEANNGKNHTSGGMTQKGGSGKIRLRPVTVDELLAAEANRNTDWNAGELLTPARQLHATFGEALQTDKEVATTIEAESEFLLPPEKDLEKTVIAPMKSLEGSRELQEKFGIRKMEPVKSKTYQDFYFDVVPKDAKDDRFKHLFLKSAVVLRRRMVPKDDAKGVKGDPPGTCLFSVKGRSFSAKGETVRLAAQVQLAEAALGSGKEAQLLRRFLADDSVDNPFGRTVCDAILHRPDGKAALAFLRAADGWELKPVLKVISTRHKCLMELAGSTGIDFSADEATCTIEGRPTSTLCSFEFGVGHPGLVASATGAAPGQSVTATTPSAIRARDARARRLEQMKREGKIKEGGALVSRPYHVPDDLENDELFEKPDFLQYQGLRDALVAKLFKLDAKALPRGGNKAQEFAIRAGLIERPVSLVPQVPVQPQPQKPPPQPPAKAAVPKGKLVLKWPP